MTLTEVVSHRHRITVGIVREASAIIFIMALHGSKAGGSKGCQIAVGIVVEARPSFLTPGVE